MAAKNVDFYENVGVNPENIKFTLFTNASHLIVKTKFLTTKLSLTIVYTTFYFFMCSQQKILARHATQMQRSLIT